MRTGLKGAVLFYVFLCALLRMVYPVHVFEYKDYFSTDISICFWLVISSVSLLLGLFYFLLQKPKESGGRAAGNKKSTFKPIIVVFLIWLSSFQTFDMLNGYKLAPARTIAMYTGVLLEKRIDRCGSFSDCYFVSVRVDS